MVRGLAFRKSLLVTGVEDGMEGMDRKESERVPGSLGNGWWAKSMVVRSLELIAEVKL